MINTPDTTPCEPEALKASASEAEAVRYEGDETYRIMADAMPQIVWAAGAEGGRDYFNQRWHEHTHMNAAQTKGWGWLTALHQEDVERCRAAWTRAVQHPEAHDVFEMEYRLLCAEDQSYRWFMERALPVFDPQGRILKWFGTCTDIHDLKLAQNEIGDLNVRLKRAMIETHHRVKNNLQIISAMLDMQLMNDTEVIPADEFRRLASHVRTLATVHDILTKESKQEDAQQSISLQEVLEKLLPIHQQIAPHCRITAKIDDIGLPGRQGTSLALVINELISNAIKHGKGRVEIIVVEEAGRVAVTVCDDGAGFPDGFNPTVAANTGLELVQNLVQWDLAGKVEFANQPQGGAQVTLALPLQ